MKGTADVALMTAASLTVQTLRELLTQLSAVDAATAFQAIVKARPVLHVTVDRLRIALKGRAVRKQRINANSETPWSVKSPAGTGLEIQPKGNHIDVQSTHTN